MRGILCLTLLVTVTVTVTVTMAQRSPYAPRPVGYPEVLNRFNTDNDDNDLPNRVGGGNGTSTTSNPGPLKTPEGSIGDPYLVPRLPEWPREHQPFWYLNQQHIMNHRGQRIPDNQTSTARPGTQQAGGQGNRQQAGGQANRQQAGGQANRQQAGGQANRQQAGGQANRQQAGGQLNRQQPGQGQGFTQQGRQPSRQSESQFPNPQN